MTTKSFLIDTEFKGNDSRVRSAISELKKATEQDSIVIAIAYNAGGDVRSVDRLIIAIDSTNAKNVKLVFAYRAVSAAAYLFSYYMYYEPKDHVLIDVNKPLSLVYHRPRIGSADKSIFVTSHNFNKQIRLHQYLEDITAVFDEVFDKMIADLTGNGADIAPHMQGIYYLNGDVHISYARGLK